MNTNNKLDTLKEELIQKTIAIRKKIESTTKSYSSKELYIEILLDIEKVLSSHPIDIKKLRQDKVGIGRVVTDGDENTPIGQDVLLFHSEIHNYLKALEAMNNEQSTN